MRPANESTLSLEERTHELARLLAVGLLRLRDRHALAAPSTAPPTPLNTAENSLEKLPELP
jgi:hypothetical protein